MPQAAPNTVKMSGRSGARLCPALYQYDHLLGGHERTLFFSLVISCTKHFELFLRWTEDKYRPAGSRPGYLPGSGGGTKALSRGAIISWWTALHIQAGSINASINGSRSGVTLQGYKLFLRISRELEVRFCILPAHAQYLPLRFLRVYAFS